MLGVAALFALLLAVRWASGMRRTGGAPAHRRAEGAAPTCFDVTGASSRPGLRCVLGALAEDVRPLPPCDDPASLRRVRFLVERCPLQGRRLILAPRDGTGGRCVPRLELLPGPVRLALGLPLDLDRALPSDLAALPGVGPATVRALLRFRALLPPGRQLELSGVPGLGERRRRLLERRLVRTGPERPGCGASASE